MQDLKIFFREHRSSLLKAFLGLLLLFQFAGFVSVLSEHIDPRSILSSRDADASHIVGTANKTRWYKDNGESAYGAFFYRTIHTFGVLTGREFANQDSASENSERAHHLVVMVLSLLSVYGISFLLGSLLFKNLNHSLLFTVTLTALFLSNSTWTQFVFRAHPDMMFGLFILAAFIATAKALSAGPESIWFKISALLWGASGMVKLSFVMFLPVIWLLWMPPFNKANFRLSVNYYLWMLPSYLLLGFPQSFNFPRSLRFLSNQSQFSIPATPESVQAWFADLSGQLLWPAVAVAGLALFSPRKGQVYFRLLPLLLFPFLLLLKQNSEYQTDYYLIPIVSIALAWLAWGFSGRLKLRSEQAPLGPLLVFALAVFWSVGFVPKTMEAELDRTLGCRKQALDIYRSIHSHIDQGKVFALDPYIAFDRTRAGTQANSSWANNWARVTELNATALAINTGYAKKFVGDGDPSQGTKVDVPNWQESREFYRSLLGQSQAQDPNKNRWIKTEEACGWEIWLRE